MSLALGTGVRSSLPTHKFGFTCHRLALTLIFLNCFVFVCVCVCEGGGFLVIVLLDITALLEMHLQ
jgi:hypothetical protein